ncbi:MAG: hypothetical protein PUP91_25230 [Rhizonema sp. PD37]|nr:hypothetical protein [Rhizonema sp. PD37]
MLSGAVWWYLVNCLVVSGQLSGNIWQTVWWYLVNCLVVSGQLSGGIWSTIWWYLVNCLVISGRLSGNIWPTIWWYLVNYLVVSGQLSGGVWSTVWWYLVNCLVVSGQLSGEVVSEEITMLATRLLSLESGGVSPDFIKMLLVVQFRKNLDTIRSKTAPRGFPCLRKLHFFDLSGGYMTPHNLS